MILELDHVQLTIPRGAESVARQFYGAVLQLQEIEKPVALRSRGGVWYQLADGRQLHLGVEVPFHANRKAHPCFVVSSIDELTEVLRGGGFSVIIDELAAPISRIYTADPFGNRLEFADRSCAMKPGAGKP